MVRVQYRGNHSFVHNEAGELSEGDVVEIGDYTYEQFGFMFRPVDDDEGDTDTAPDSAETEDDAAEPTAETDDLFDPNEHTVSDLRDELGEMGLSAEMGEALLAAERDGKNRETALDAIEAAMPDTAETDDSDSDTDE